MQFSFQDYTHLPWPEFLIYHRVLARYRQAQAELQRNAADPNWQPDDPTAAPATHWSWADIQGGAREMLKRSGVLRPATPEQIQAHEARLARRSDIEQGYIDRGEMRP